MDTNSMPASPAQSPAPELVAIRHAVEKLRHGIFSKESFLATIKATLRQHGRGARSISDLAPASYSDMLFQLRLALPRHLASKGPVFPLRAGTKRPRNNHGFSDATTDMKVIREWVEAYGDTEWGITGNVVDIDTKKPRTDLGRTRCGVETWAAILAEGNHAEPNTLSAISPSGSTHFYIQETLPNIDHALGDGVDTRRFKGGYVVAPGSHVVADGKSVMVTGFYSWRNDEPVRSVPWIAELAAKGRPKADEGGERGDEVENPEPIIALEKAAAMLRELNPADYREQTAWFNLMCSFHHVTAGEGFAEFDAWSMSDEGYAGNRDFESRWDSLKVHEKGDIDEGLLFNAVKEASDAGLRLVLEAEGFHDDIPEIPDDPAASKSAYPPPLSAKELFKGNFPDVEYLLEGLIVQGITQTLYGDGAVGKSMVAAQASVAIASGKALFGRKCKQSPVLFITDEDDYGQTRKRMLAMARSLGLSDEEFQVLPLRTWCLSGEYDIMLAQVTDVGVIKRLRFCREFEKQLEASGEGTFVVLDCLNDIVQMNDILRAPPNAFFKGLLKPLCDEYKATILVLAHPSKKAMEDGSWYSGGTANRTAVRHQLVMKLVVKDRLDGPRSLETLKLNWGGISKPIRLSFNNGIFVWDSEDDIAMEQASRDQIVLAHVIKLIRKGVLVGISNKGSATHPEEIAEQLKSNPELPGITGKDVEKILRAAVRDHKLHYEANEKGRKNKLAHLTLPKEEA